MKKIPLHTTIFFYLALLPIVLFLLLCVFYGDIYEIFGGIIWIVSEGGWALLPVVAVVAGLQVSAIVNYIDAYRQSNSYQRYNDNKIPLFTVKFFYFSLVMTLIFVIFFIIFVFYGVLILPLIILLPFIIILQVSGIVDYVDAYKNKDTHKDKE